MISDTNLLQRYMAMQKALITSLRLKDVLEAATQHLSELPGGAKVAIFLADNEGLAFKLMSARGYSEATMEQLRIVPFTAESLLKEVAQKRASAVAGQGRPAPDISHTVMQRENSKTQIALPLIASKLMVGALLIDLSDPMGAAQVPLLQEVANIIALSVANAILFGRSEFERERLNTLYKTTCALNSSVLKVAEVLQIAADTVLVLSNTADCMILLNDPEKENALKVTAFKGFDGRGLDQLDLSLSNTITGRAMSSGKPEYLPDAGNHAHGLPRAADGSNFGSALALPMIHDGKALGAILVFAIEQRGFHREQIELLESLVAQVATALSTALTHESVTAQAIEDAHTGLYNRWHFEESLAKEIERSQRHKRDLAVMLIDIDHLSHVNEYFGQDKGDEAIKHAAAIIKETLRDIDIPCRTAGAQFGIILPETPLQNANDVADRLRQKIRGKTAPGIGMVTVSIGLAACPYNATDAEQLLQAAEQALDVAKYEGRDRVKLAELGQQNQGPIAWEELATKARLAVVGERQAKMKHVINAKEEFSPWMRSAPTLFKKKSD